MQAEKILEVTINGMFNRLIEQAEKEKQRRIEIIEECKTMIEDILSMGDAL